MKAFNSPDHNCSLHISLSAKLMGLGYGDLMIVENLMHRQNTSLNQIGLITSPKTIADDLADIERADVRLPDDFSYREFMNNLKNLEAEKLPNFLKGIFSLDDDDYFLSGFDHEYALACYIG
jgi:hypothetical protein